MKTALVLEGGGMRGAYTCGTIDFLLDNNIHFDGVIGVSAGACHATSYISEQRGRAIRIGAHYLVDKRSFSFKSLIQTGDLFNAQFIYDEIPNVIDPFDYKTFNNSKTRMYCVCFDCENGQSIYAPIPHIQENMEYIRASASLPIISKIVEFDGHKMLDGGLGDSIPFEFMMDKGYDKIVVVSTKVRGYRKSSNKLMPMIEKMYKEYPYVIDACKNRHTRYNAQFEKMEELEKEGKLFVIYPSDTHGVGRLEQDVVKLENLYKTGYQDAQDCKDALCEYLQIA